MPRIGGRRIRGALASQEITTGQGAARAPAHAGFEPLGELPVIRRELGVLTATPTEAVESALVGDTVTTKAISDIFMTITLIEAIAVKVGQPPELKVPHLVTDNRVSTISPTFQKGEAVHPVEDGSRWSRRRDAMSTDEARWLDPVRDVHAEVGLAVDVAGLGEDVPSS